MTPDEGPTQRSPPGKPVPEFSDSELVHRGRDGDEAAFQLLFDRHYAAVRGVAARILLDLAAAEDVAQETFIRAARSLDRIIETDGFRFWLFRVATNLCRDHIRSRVRRDLREQEFASSALLQRREHANCSVPDFMSLILPRSECEVAVSFFDFRRECFTAKSLQQGGPSQL